MPDALQSPGRRAWKRFRSNRPAFAGLLFLGLAVAVSILGPLPVTHVPDAPGELQFAPPGADHWLGTDIHGRDLLARLLMATRISLAVGGVGAVLGLLIGVSWGMVAAYAGGRADAWMMRTVDVLHALPNVVFVMLVMSVFESTFAGRLSSVAPSASPLARMALLVLCLGAVSWLTMARIVRGQVLALRERPFVLASQALGTGPLRIVLRHLLPNIAGVVIVSLTLTVPAVVLQESFLSFLGLGVRPPQASLGTLIADGAAQLNPVRMRLWLLLFPAGMLALMLSALNLVGDGLRDALEPRDRGR
jgi:peptide/nickel transport system permease protein/oligopeptide transport system permease protein